MLGDVAQHCVLHLGQAVVIDAHGGEREGGVGRGQKGVRRLRGRDTRLDGVRGLVGAFIIKRGLDKGLLYMHMSKKAVAPEHDR